MGKTICSQQRHGSIFAITFRPKAGTCLNRDINRFHITRPQRMKKQCALFVTAGVHAIRPHLDPCHTSRLLPLYLLGNTVEKPPPSP